METDIVSSAVQVFTPDPERLYPIEVAAQMAKMPRHIVLVCCRRSLVNPYIEPEYGGLLFDHETIGRLQRIEYLRSGRGVNFAGIEIILQLMAEIENR